MAEASLSGSVPNRTERMSEEATKTIRAGATFVLVLVIFVVFWQVIKVVLNLDSLTLPHIGDIVGALFQPVQEGQPILGGILFKAALFTLTEASVGFAIGALVGFVLAVIFAHSRLLERGLITEESDQHQYRMVDIVDLDTNKPIYQIEHEVRSMRHPMFNRVFVNRNADMTNRNFIPGYEVGLWALN